MFRKIFNTSVVEKITLDKLVNNPYKMNNVYCANIEWCDICKKYIQTSNNTIKILPLYKKPLLLSADLSKKSGGT